MQQVSCEICGKTFLSFRSAKRRFCGRLCYLKTRDGWSPTSGKVYTKEERKKISVSNMGRRAWNKGLSGFSWGVKGEKNAQWKGEGASYRSKHRWVYSVMGKPTKCEHCKTKTGRLEWANLSGEHKRIAEDWIGLCKRCHFYFDIKRHRRDKSNRFIKCKKPRL